MAIKQVLVCDEGEEEGEGVTRYSFSIDGTAYVVDLCDKHAKIIEKLKEMATYVKGAKPVMSPGLSKPQRAKVREWAQTAGLKVAYNGQLSSDVIRQAMDAGVI